MNHLPALARLACGAQGRNMSQNAPRGRQCDWHLDARPPGTLRSVQSSPSLLDPGVSVLDTSYHLRSKKRNRKGTIMVSTLLLPGLLIKNENEEKKGRGKNPPHAALTRNVPRSASTNLKPAQPWGTCQDRAPTAAPAPTPPAPSHTPPGGCGVCSPLSLHPAEPRPIAWRGSPLPRKVARRSYWWVAPGVCWPQLVSG